MVVDAFNLKYVGSTGRQNSLTVKGYTLKDLVLNLTKKKKKNAVR